MEAHEWTGILFSVDDLCEIEMNVRADQRSVHRSHMAADKNLV